MSPELVSMARLCAGGREAQAGRAQGGGAQEARQDGLPCPDRGPGDRQELLGKSWCLNLARYSDYESRLPRGRTYVRNGSVVDLQIDKGRLTALVAGSELYKISITIAPLAAPRWKAICRDCAGSVDSLVELLQGCLAQGVMDRVCRKGDGLFPSPAEIKLSCSCLDWAEMCKHVAAVLYGVGARLDERPELLFVLRGVDQNELTAASQADLTLAQKAPEAAKRLDDNDVAALFGIEMAVGAPRAAAETKAPLREKAKPTAKKRPKRGSAKTRPRSWAASRSA